MAATRVVVRMPPGPRPTPIFSKHVAKLLFYHDPIAYHRNLYQTYGTLVRFAAGSTKIVAYGPEYNRQVLSQPDLFHAIQIAPPGPDDVLHRLSSGLPNMNGETHKRSRRLIMPAFHKQHVAAHVADMVALTDACITRWTIEAMDMAAAMRDLTRSISSTLLFGRYPSANDDALAHLIDRWIAMTSSAVVQLFPLNYPGMPYQRLVSASKQLEQYMREIVAERRRTGSDRHDVLTLLLHVRDEDGTQFTDDDLIGQLNVMFIAAFETTAMALTWTLFLLSQHPQVIADLVDELDHVLYGNAPTLEQLGILPLLDGVIRESLRLLPPVSQGARAATAPFMMGGYTFPAGTKVLYSEYITHHMPELYTEPDRFLPERWLTINPSPYEYFPFLAGSRMCVGATFAMTEMKVILAMILQRYRLTMVPGAVIDRHVRFTLVPKYGMPMSITAQDRQFTKVPVCGNIHEMVDLK